MRYEWDRRGQVTGDGRPLATVRHGRLRGWAEVRFGPVTWRYAVRGRDRTATRGLDAGPAYVARQTSVLPPCWEVSDGTRVLTVTGDTLSHWMTVRCDGLAVGRAGPARNWTTRPCLEVDPPLAPELAAFLLWVRYAAARDTGG